MQTGKHNKKSFKFPSIGNNSQKINFLFNLILLYNLNVYLFGIKLVFIYCRNIICELVQHYVICCRFFPWKFCLFLDRLPVIVYKYCKNLQELDLLFNLNSLKKLDKIREQDTKRVILFFLFNIT